MQTSRPLTLVVNQLRGQYTPTLGRGQRFNCGWDYRTRSSCNMSHFGARNEVAVQRDRGYGAVRAEVSAHTLTLPNFVTTASHVYFFMPVYPPNAFLALTMPDTSKWVSPAAPS